MGISETQLETWSHQGSVVQSEATYQTIKRTLESSDSPYSGKRFDVFLQGSYGNDTNIYSESDVDIVICLKSAYYYDLDWLDEVQKENFNSRLSPVTYGLDEFKRDVLAWLTKHYGSDVTVGSKAIKIAANSGRRDADVLVCMENRLYRYYHGPSNQNYHSGIKFKTTKGKWIVNFPKQHQSNSTTKSVNTRSRFKPNVRVFKNMRNAMAKDGLLSKKRAPSYFIEGMLWNVPNDRFMYTYYDTFEASLNWLETSAIESKLMCANNIHFLVRNAPDVCWSSEDYNATLKAYRKYWED